MILKLSTIGIMLLLAFKMTDVEGIVDLGGGSGSNDGSCNGENSKLKVSISIDSLNQDTITFMKNSVQPIFEELSSCILWDFIPCSTSCIVQDVLQCKSTIQECRVDALYACASNYFKDQPNNAAKFLLCMMTSENQMAAGQECANQAGIDWTQLQGCKPCEAGQLCENRYNLLVQINQPNIPKVMFNLKYDCEVEQNAIKNLKGTICDQIKQNNMQCLACNGSGSGGGTEGGGKKDDGPIEAPPGTPNFQFFDNGKYFSYNGFLLPNTSVQLD
ncbi:GILT-like protein 1 [Planococcus citri]|uniref:GILT-like protein 1 n=1 Tax=Planococcus citri TaxID=170843 RepID=UPI0031F927B8